MKLQDIFLEFRNFRMGKYLQLMFFSPNDIRCHISTKATT